MRKLSFCDITAPARDRECTRRALYINGCQLAAVYRAGNIIKKFSSKNLQLEAREMDVEYMEIDDSLYRCVIVVAN